MKRWGLKGNLFDLRKGISLHTYASYAVIITKHLGKSALNVLLYFTAWSLYCIIDWTHCFGALIVQQVIKETHLINKKHKNKKRAERSQSPTSYRANPL